MATTRPIFRGESLVAVNVRLSRGRRAGPPIVAHEAADIADGLARVLEDSQPRLELMRRGLAQTTKFTWERTATGTLSAYPGC